MAPSLTHDQKMQIADLTGNVPLALDVVGAIFKFPDAPTVNTIIKGLREHPLHTLSPDELHFSDKVEVSIRLAYNCLKQELKQFCINLSHFPGSFHRKMAKFLFRFIADSMLDELVQRSLLQSSHGRKRFYFHQLLRIFFKSQKGRIFLQNKFDARFQLYFIGVLEEMVEDNYFDFTTLDEEKHNINHMFTLFNTAKNRSVTFHGVQVGLRAMEAGMLQIRFLPAEIHIIAQHMLSALDSYKVHEQAKMTSFMDTYLKVVKLVAQLQWSVNKADAIKTLSSRKETIDKGYQRGQLDVSNFTDYKEIGENGRSSRCHTYILSTIHGQLKHCSHQDCDYLSISIAYEEVGDKLHAFEFRELAYQHQNHSLTNMVRAKLILDLYNDYSNGLIGNDMIKASVLSPLIENNIYTYLVTASAFEYSEKVFFIAISYFKERNMKEKVDRLEVKMINNDPQCKKNKCARPLKRGEY